MLFLEKVRRHNKFLFAGMLLFIIGQLLFFGRGVSCSPWYNSGMFSEVIKPKANYQVYQLAPRYGPLVSWLSPQYDDKIFFTLDQYHALDSLRVYNQLVRVYKKIGTAPPGFNQIVRMVKPDEFYKWFIPYASAWVNIQYSDTGYLSLAPVQAVWDGRQLNVAQK